MGIVLKNPILAAKPRVTKMPDGPAPEFTLHLLVLPFLVLLVPRKCMCVLGLMVLLLPNLLIAACARWRSPPGGSPPSWATALWETTGCSVAVVRCMCAVLCRTWREWWCLEWLLQLWFPVWTLRTRGLLLLPLRGTLLCGVPVWLMVPLRLLRGVPLREIRALPLLLLSYSRGSRRSTSSVATVVISWS